MRPKEVTPRLLKALLRWGYHCSLDPNYFWTKWDAEDYCLIQQEYRKFLHREYKKNAK